MAAPHILDIVSAFFQRSFTKDAATRLFGPERPAATPGPIRLVSPDRDLQVSIEMAGAGAGAAAGGPPFLAGLILALNEPAPAWFNEMERRFGPPEELPLLYAHADYVSRFPVRGLEYPGYVLLSASDDKKRPHQAILRRYLPEPG